MGSLNKPAYLEIDRDYPVIRKKKQSPLWKTIRVQQSFGLYRFYLVIESNTTILANVTSQTRDFTYNTRIS